MADQHLESRSSRDPWDSEDVLPESHQFLQATFDALGAHIAILDENGTIIAVNAAWRRFADANGYAAPGYGVGVNYMRVCEAAPLDDATAHQAAAGIRTVIACQRDEFYLEYPCHSPSEQRWFALRATRFAGDGPIRVVVAHEHITERKLTEEALRGSEERYRSLFDNAQEAILLVDDQACCVDANPAARALTGYAREELLSRTIRDITPVEHRARTPESWRRFLAAGRTSGEFTLLRKDGSTAEVDYHAVASIVPGLHMLVLSDITERKRAEEALRQFAERLKILHGIDRAILAARSPEQIAQAALNRMRQLVPCQRAGVLMIGSGTREAVTLIVDSSNEFWVEMGIQLPPELFGGGGAIGAEVRRQGEPAAPEPLILARPPAFVQALLADGVRSYMLMPLVSQGTLIGSLALGAATEDAFSSEHQDIVREVADSMAVAIQQARLYEQVRAGSEQLHNLSRRLVEAQETERRQLAHELHDQVGQTLTALNISLNIARNHLSAESAAKIGARLDEAARLAEETIERIRDVIVELRPAVLDDYGLAAALRWYARRFAERTEINVEVQAADPASEERLPPDMETALFRITQEALTNIAKHAHARHVTVLLEIDEQTVRLIVADEGVGFDPTEPRESGERRGLGLIGMRERIEAIGGRLSIRSTPGKGARVIAEVAR